MKKTMSQHQVTHSISERIRVAKAAHDAGTAKKVDTRYLYEIVRDALWGHGVTLAWVGYARDGWALVLADSPEEMGPPLIRDPELQLEVVAQAERCLAELGGFITERKTTSQGYHGLAVTRRQTQTSLFG